MKRNFVTYIAFATSAIIHAVMLFSVQKTENVTVKNFGLKNSERTLAKASLYIKPRQIKKIQAKSKKFGKNKLPKKTLSKQAVPMPNVSKRVVKESLGKNSIVAEYASIVRNLIAKNKKYPRVAKRLKQQGVVKVYFEVTYPNKINNLRILETSQYELLDKSAVETILSLDDLPQVPKEYAEAPIQLTVPLNYELL